MRRSVLFILVLLWAAGTLFLLTPNGMRSTAQTRSDTSKKVVVPRIWDAKELATWATPVAG